MPLLTPGITIMSVGTEIRYGNTMAPDHGWEKELSVGWDREAIVEEAGKLNLKFQVRDDRDDSIADFVAVDSCLVVLC